MVFLSNDLRRPGSHHRSLRIRTIRHVAVFELDRISDSFSAAVLQFGGHIYWEWPAKCTGWSSIEPREFRAQQKSCGRELCVTACDSCFFAKRENILLEHHRWQFLTSDPRFKEHMSLQCQGNHEHVWKQIHEGKREYPVAKIRRLVNGFVHDFRLPQLHIFLSEADRLLSASRSFRCTFCSRNRR